jgi:cell division protease FtsH
MARRMVTEFGMSEVLGPLRYSENEEEVFLGHSVTQRKNVSDETAKLIDQEVRRIVEEGEGKAREILTKNLDGLHIVAKALLEYETLSGEEVRALLRGEKIRQGTTDTNTPKPRSSIPTAGATVARPGGLEPRPQPGA